MFVKETIIMVTETIPDDGVDWKERAEVAEKKFELILTYATHLYFCNYPEGPCSCGLEGLINGEQ